MGMKIPVFGKNILYIFRWYIVIVTYSTSRKCCYKLLEEEGHITRIKNYVRNRSRKRYRTALGGAVQESTEEEIEERYTNGELAGVHLVYEGNGQVATRIYRERLHRQAATTPQVINNCQVSDMFGV